MSTTSSVTSSSGVNYAMQLAQTSSLQRSLYNLGSAIDGGNLTSAKTIFNAVMKANPDYATSPSDSSSGSTSTGNPINDGFQAVAAALDANDAAGAKAAWTQLKSDLADSGVKITDGKTATAELLAQSSASVSQSILSGLFGGSSDASSLVSTLLGGGATSGSSVSASINAAISNWLTYKADGSTATSATSSSSSTLDKAV